MYDFLAKCVVFGGIAFAFWLLTFSGRSTKQSRRDRARQIRNEEERQRLDDADAAYYAQHIRHDHHR